MTGRRDADDAAPSPEETPVPVVPPPPVAAVHRPAGWRDRGGAAPPAAAPGPGPDAGRPALRIDRGAVTERVVSEAAAAGCRLVLGPSAVLTPSARDRARQLGVEIEQEQRR